MFNPVSGVLCACVRAPLYSSFSYPNLSYSLVKSWWPVLAVLWGAAWSEVPSGEQLLPEGRSS